MGYRIGEGLGSRGSGITAPIEQSSQIGRRGLGFGPLSAESKEIKWEEEEVRRERGEGGGR